MKTLTQRILDDMYSRSYTKFDLNQKHFLLSNTWNVCSIRFAISLEIPLGISFNFVFERFNNYDLIRSWWFWPRDFQDLFD
jgi:hypothetical protein